LCRLYSEGLEAPATPWDAAGGETGAVVVVDCCSGWSWGKVYDFLLGFHTVNFRDVPDIRFRLAGYLAIFCYPVPVPDPAKILPVTG